MVDVEPTTTGTICFANLKHRALREEFLTILRRWVKLLRAVINFKAPKVTLTMALQIGDQAPDFTLLSDQNATVTLRALRGQKVVLFFYPKDNTPGCTQEACDFRDAHQTFADSGVVVFGISKDSVAQHHKFKNKHRLPFPLLADETGEVCIAYGVIDKKSLFGNTFLGITRSTFYIDAQGKISALWRKVKVSGHIQQVINETNQS